MRLSRDRNGSCDLGIVYSTPATTLYAPGSKDVRYNVQRQESYPGKFMIREAR